MDLAEMSSEGRRLSRNIDKALEFLRADAALQAATAERDYRHAKAQAWVAHTDGTAKEREAHVDAATADLRFERDLAASMLRTAYDSLKARMAQLSYLQSEMATVRSEMEMAR